MNFYLAKLFWKAGQDDGQSTPWPSALISTLWASVAAWGPGQWRDGIIHFSLHVSIYSLHSSRGLLPLRVRNFTFLFLQSLKIPEREAKVLKVKFLRKIGQVEQERLYSVPFMNIYQQFPSRVQPLSQELYIKGELSWCVTRSYQFLLFLRRNQLTCVPSQLNTYKPDHI